LPEPRPPPAPPHRARPRAVGRPRLQDELRRHVRLPRLEPRVDDGGGDRGARGSGQLLRHPRDRPHRPDPGLRGEATARARASRLPAMAASLFARAALTAGLIGEPGIAEARQDSGRDLLPRLVGRGEGVLGYRYGGSWQAVGPLDSSYHPTLALLSDRPPME